MAFPGGEPDDTFFFGGFNYQLTEHIAFMKSFGRSFHDAQRGTPDFLSYIGLQIVWDREDGEEGEEGEDNDPESGCCPRSRSPQNLLNRRRVRPRTVAYPIRRASRPA